MTFVSRTMLTPTRFGETAEPATFGRFPARAFPMIASTCV